jgi:hypothetical protein
VSDFGLSRVLQGEQRGNVTKTTTVRVLLLLLLFSRRY